MKTAILAFAAILFWPPHRRSADCCAAMPARHGDGVRIVVPARNIARGDVISDSDLAYDDGVRPRAYGGVVDRD